MEDQLIETWEIHNRVNLYLLDAIPDAALANVAGSKGRMVGEQFAHIHDVRLMWLKAAAPELLEGLEKVPKELVTDKATLRAALTRSSEAIAALLRKSVAAGGRIRNFKPHAIAFLGYLISHESHHRGHVGLTLKQTGHPLDKKTSFGLWEWGVR
jgi:uncharacterized damage-inducible protein DinB